MVDIASKVKNSLLFSGLDPAHLAEVAANKRALYRRRYEFLDACAREFAEALKALA